MKRIPKIIFLALKLHIRNPPSGNTTPLSEVSNRGRRKKVREGRRLDLSTGNPGREQELQNIESTIASIVLRCA